MNEYHINWKGEPGICSASQGNCPFGSADDHFPSPEAARKAYEAQMSNLTEPLKSSRLNDSEMKIENIRVNMLRSLHGDWSEEPRSEGRNHLAFKSPTHGRLTYSANAGWEAELPDGRYLGKFKDFDAAIKGLANPKPRVRETKSGSLIFSSPEEKVSFVKENLNHSGYTIKLSDEDLKKPFYISRSASLVSKQVERAFSNQAQLNSYLKEWNKYDRMYDSLEVIYRDNEANSGARRWLATQNSSV